MKSWPRLGHAILVRPRRAGGVARAIDRHDRPGRVGPLRAGVRRLVPRLLEGDPGRARAAHGPGVRVLPSRRARTESRSANVRSRSPAAGSASSIVSTCSRGTATCGRRPCRRSWPAVATPPTSTARPGITNNARRPRRAPGFPPGRLVDDAFRLDAVAFAPGPPSRPTGAMSARTSGATTRRRRPPRRPW